MGRPRKGFSENSQYCSRFWVIAGNSSAPGKVQNGSRNQVFGMEAIWVVLRRDSCLTRSAIGSDDDEGATDSLNGSLRLLAAFEAGFSETLDRLRSSRFETLFSPASRSRRRTSRMTWERIALRAFASLMRLDAKSSSWSMNVKDGRSDGFCDLDDAPKAVE
jgi:hypothetical protein